MRNSSWPFLTSGRRLPVIPRRGRFHRIENHGVERPRSWRARRFIDEDAARGLAMPGRRPRSASRAASTHSRSRCGHRQPRRRDGDGFLAAGTTVSIAARWPAARASVGRYFLICMQPKSKGVPPRKRRFRCFRTRTVRRCQYRTLCAVGLDTAVGAVCRTVSLSAAPSALLECLHVRLRTDTRDDPDVATAAQLLLRRRHGKVVTLCDPAGLPRCWRRRARCGAARPEFHARFIDGARACVADVLRAQGLRRR